jgi:hypothetical protein
MTSEGMVHFFHVIADKRYDWVTHCRGAFGKTLLNSPHCSFVKTLYDAHGTTFPLSLKAPLRSLMLLLQESA